MPTPSPPSPIPPKRIAVLFHSAEQEARLPGFVIDHLASCWRDDGHEVIYLLGTRRFVPADLILVHVNLSVVPDEYLGFAARYPIVLNGRIRDIRKSTTNEHLVQRGDPWPGPVIAKSNLNFAGESERELARSWLGRRSRLWRGAGSVTARATGRAPTFESWRSYKVFESLADVPRRWLRDPAVAVERFCPEIEGGLHHLRIFQFLGDRWTCTRLGSPERLIKAETSVRVESIEPHPEVFAWRARLEMDFGKLDYVVHDGKPVLIDVNKTTGASRHLGDAELRAMRRYQAEGLYSYFRGARPAVDSPSRRSA